jgi:phage-related protein
LVALADKPLVWLEGEIKTPPFSQVARLEAGYLLRKLQQREMLGMPHSRPMPSIGSRCHELRINDESATWRIVYRLDGDALSFSKSSVKRVERHPKQLLTRVKGG